MKIRKTPAPIVLYRGPSLFDGSPIVVLATVGSKNEKTGPMVQTWILPVMGPLAASKIGADASVCGTCTRRHSLGGDCYVLIANAPHSAWKKWKRHGSRGANWTRENQIMRLAKSARDHGLRIGSYGDPLAVPAHVWSDLIDALQPRMRTGYSHAWRMAHAAEYRGLVMASCDSVADHDQASALGWRTFSALATDERPDRAIECLADARDLTCDACGICDGARTDRAVQPVSVWIAEHGVRSAGKARRSALLTVIR